MEQLYGESPEIRIEESYNTNGGIALFSTNDDDTITGGSGNEGEYPTSTRIRWEITRILNEDGTYTYTGGVTGGANLDDPWYVDNMNSPFYNVDINDIGTVAFRDKNLNYYFDLWNQDSSNQGQYKRGMFAATAGLIGCATVIGG